MKKLRLVLTVVLAISVLALSVCAYASDITLKADKSSAEIGETVELTVFISNSQNASSGSISINHGTGTIIMDGEWEIDDTTISTYDDMTEKGAFMIEGERKISGEIFEFEAKLAKGATGINDIKVTVTLQNDAGDVFNKTGSVSISAKGAVETTAATTAESTTAETSSSETVTKEEITKSEKTTEADKEDASETAGEESKADETKAKDGGKYIFSSNITAYLIFGGAGLILLIVIIVTFKKSKK